MPYYYSMMNQRMYVIAISCACLLITTLKNFSGNIASFLERETETGKAQEPAEEPPEEPSRKEAVPSEAKKDD